jgi:hypothetical protein
MSMATNEWSEQVLEETPSRVTRFISGIGGNAVIRTLMERGGMTDADIEEGTRLLTACLAMPPVEATRHDSVSAQQQRQAVATLDAWDEPNLARYKAALDRRFPTVSERMFHELGAATGAAAVQGVATFLLRVDGCEHVACGGNAAVARDVAMAAELFQGVSAEACRGAIELLGQRGLDRNERRRLAELVGVALGNTETIELQPPAEQARLNRRRAAQRALRAWFEEWATTARAVLSRRDHLIRLGLAKRKAPTSKQAATPRQGRRVEAASMRD